MGLWQDDFKYWAKHRPCTGRVWQAERLEVIAAKTRATRHANKLMAASVTRRALDEWEMLWCEARVKDSRLPPDPVPVSSLNPAGRLALFMALGDVGR